MVGFEPQHDSRTPKNVHPPRSGATFSDPPDQPLGQRALVPTGGPLYAAEVMALPVISVEQMRRWEAATWESGKTEEEVIARVGEVVAARAMELTQPGDAILLLAGKGHNGDDVRAMAGHLPGREVSLLSVTDPAKTRQKLPLDLDPAPTLVVDGLFGIGLNRPLDADWMQVMAQVNANRLRVLSVDTPSGIDAASGEVQGAAIRAEETLTLGAAKLGLLRPSASEYVGRLRVAPDIGLTPCRETSDLLLGQADDFCGFPPARPAGGHKGTFGHLGIMAGSLGYHGAAVLAARGATRAQPGLLTLLTPDEVFVPVASQLQGVMVRPLVPGEITVHSITGLLIGPGLAADDLPADLKETTGEMWRESSVPMVVDASALDWLPSGKTPDKSIRVITPHPGEAARLFNLSTDAVQADRVETLRALSAKFGGCWVVLKGQHTLIGRAEGEVFVNPTGNPALGQGGSGDLLAGYLAGLLVQPLLREDVCRTIRYAAWQHGAAADELACQAPNWVVEELAKRIGSVQV